MIEDLDLNRKIEVAPVSDKGIPLGYIPIVLSMAGKFGVPSVVNCRNFTTAELVDISLFNNNYLTERIIHILNGCIYEETDVALWPDKAIIELLVHIYGNFFSDTLKDITFPWNDEDIAHLEKEGRQDKINDLKSGKWIPHVDIPVSSIHTKKVGSNIGTYLTFSKKDAKGDLIFKAKFLAYPRFGDVLLLDKIVNQKFEEEEKTFKIFEQKLDQRESLRRRDGDVNLIPIEEKDYYQYQLYQVKKLKYLTLATLAIYLVELNGSDMTSVSIDEKIKVVSGYIFDVGLGNQLFKKFDEIDFGIDPEIELVNPVTGVPCKRQFTFQVLALLQTIRTSDSNGYDISYDD